MTQGFELQRQPITAFQYALPKASDCLRKLKSRVWGYSVSHLAWPNFLSSLCIEEFDGVVGVTIVFALNCLIYWGALFPFLRGQL